MSAALMMPVWQARAAGSTATFAEAVVTGHAESYVGRTGKRGKRPGDCAALRIWWSAAPVTQDRVRQIETVLA